PRHTRLVGLALGARDGTTCYLPLAHAGGPNVTSERAREWLALVLADASVPKVGEDLKRDAHLLAGAGFSLHGFAFDLHVGSFLCDPARGHSIESLARDFLALDLELGEPAAEVAGPARAGRPRDPETLSPERVGAWAERAVAAVFPLADHLRAQLESRQQWGLYQQLEHPLTAVLLEMEKTGVMLDVAVLAEMRSRAAVEIARLEEELYALAGERINLNSG